MVCDRGVTQSGRCLQGDGVPSAAAGSAFSGVATQPCLFETPGLNGPSVEVVDWDQAEQIGMGGYATVFQVAPGYVAKVGDILPREAEFQRWGAERGYGLPVADYQEAVAVPDRISQEFCPVHGSRHRIVLDDDCRCGESLDVLVMPKAEPLDPALARSERAEAFQQRVVDEAFDEGRGLLDLRPANLMGWKGKIVVVDWGEDGA